MPTVNKASATHQYANGADRVIETLLSEADAIEAYGAGSVTGWYAFSHVQKSDFGPTSGRELIRDERNTVTTTINKEDGATYNGTLMQSDTATLKLLDILARKPHSFRFGYKQADGTTQMHGLRNAYVPGDWRLNNAAGALRTLDIQIVASPTDAGDAAHVFEDVGADEATWPASMDDFKTAAVAA